VITIAHRIQTIINSDKILVLGDGKNMEYGSPQELLKDSESEFTKLVNELKE
jgi:ABC-type multidrug transport system fused ATPase/permease subunit